MLDYYESVKYVIAHSRELGVDRHRVCIVGESGGGYICSSTMVYLAMQEEAQLIKLAIPIIPMLTDYCFGDPSAMTKEESENSGMQRLIWQLIAKDEVKLRN